MTRKQGAACRRRGDPNVFRGHGVPDRPGPGAEVRHPCERPSAPAWRSLRVLPGLVALSMMLGSIGPLSAGKGSADQARVHVIVSTADGVPIAGAKLRIVLAATSEVREGVTGEDGEWVLNLPQGARYDITCRVGTSTYSFGTKQIPAPGTPLEFTLKLSIQRHVVAAPRSSSTQGSSNAHVIVTVVNSLDQPEPDARIAMEEVGTGKRIEFETDSRGRHELDLPRGARYRTTCDKYGVTFDMGTQTIPAVDTFRLTLKVILEESVLDTEGARVAGSKPAVVAVILSDRHGNPESGALVRVTSLQSGRRWEGVTDSLGRYVFSLPRSASYNIAAEKNGVTFDTGRHEVGDLDEMEIAIQVSLVTSYVEVRRLENVYFDFDSATLRPESFASLDDLVEIMKKRPTMTVELAGHTDARGDAAYNLKLSRARANAVRDYLIAHGIDRNRVTAKGYGELEPVASNDTPEGRQRNRRTELRVITK